MSNTIPIRGRRVGVRTIDLERAMFYDSRISGEAKGVCGLLNCIFDNGNDIWFDDLLKYNARCGRDKMRRILRELEQACYLRRETKRGKGGKFYWLWEIHQEPFDASLITNEEEPCPENQAMVSPPPENPATENQAILVTDSVTLPVASNLVTQLDTTYLIGDEASPALLSEVEEKIAIKDITPIEVPPNGKHNNGKSPKKERVSPEQKDGSSSLHKQLFSRLHELMKIDPKLNGSRIGKLAKELLAADYTPEQLQLWYGPGGWWYTSYWKGIRGNPPNFEDFHLTIKQAAEGLVANSSADEAAQALEILKQVIRDVGRYGSPDGLGPKTRAAVAKMGGWYDVCNMQERDLPFRFKQVYGR